MLECNSFFIGRICYLFLMKEGKGGYVAKGSFEEEVRGFCSRFSGIGNFHIHGDRAYTRRDKFYGHVGISVRDIDKLSLFAKQRLTWALHRGSAFESDCIVERMNRLIEESIRYGVNKIFTTVDVTYNTKFKSLDVAEQLKKQYAGRVDIQIGAYNPSGFKKRGIADGRFEIFEEAARRSDFLVALAEKDRGGVHIGERQHNWYMLNLAYKLNKPLH